MGTRTYTLTEAGVSVFQKWSERAVASNPNFFHMDRPHLTRAGYAAAHVCFLAEGPGAATNRPCDLHPALSRVVGTKEFNEYLRLNAAALLDAGVIRLTRLSTDPCVAAKTNYFLMLNWTPNSTALIHNPLVRDVAVAYRLTDDSPAATWFFGTVDLDTKEIKFDDGSRDTLHLSEDEYVIDPQAVNWLRRWPDSIFIRLNKMVPVLYSCQQATVRTFCADLAFLKQRVVMEDVKPDRLAAYGDCVLRTFMETHSREFLLPGGTAPASPPLGTAG